LSDPARVVGRKTPYEGKVGLETWQQIWKFVMGF